MTLIKHSNTVPWSEKKSKWILSAHHSFQISRVLLQFCLRRLCFSFCSSLTLTQQSFLHETKLRAEFDLDDSSFLSFTTINNSIPASPKIFAVCSWILLSNFWCLGPCPQNKMHAEAQSSEASNLDLFLAIQHAECVSCSSNRLRHHEIVQSAYARANGLTWPVYFFPFNKLW